VRHEPGGFRPFLGRRPEERVLEEEGAAVEEQQLRFRARRRGLAAADAPRRRGGGRGGGQGERQDGSEQERGEAATGFRLGVDSSVTRPRP
jgi:hypothetical protein